mgnify:CR=1 FL=1
MSSEGGTHACELVVFVGDGLNELIDVMFGLAAVLFQDFEDTFERLERAGDARRFRNGRLRELRLLLQAC